MVEDQDATLEVEPSLAGESPDPEQRIERWEARVAALVVGQTVRDLKYVGTSAPVRTDAINFVLSGRVVPWLRSSNADPDIVRSRYQKMRVMARKAATNLVLRATPIPQEWFLAA